MSGGSERQRDSFEERRLHPRVSIPIPARYRLSGSDEWRDAEVRNLSAGGAALSTAESLAEQSVLSELRFQLPGIERTISVAAAVLRSEPDADGSQLAGLHFLNLGGQEFELVRLCVYRRLSGAGAGD